MPAMTRARVPTRALRIAAALASPMLGCMFFTSAGEGKALRKDVDQIKSDVQLQREQLDATVTKAEEQLAKVQAATEEATKLLARNSADVGAQVAETRAALEKVQGQIAEAQAAIEGLRKELGEYRASTDVRLEQITAQGKAAAAPPVPEDKQQLFAEAQRRLDAAQYDEARRLFRAYLNRFGGDDQADNSQFLIGESYFREDKYAAAIGEFQKVIDGFPRGDVVDRAFWKNGLSFLKLKYCTDARVFLQEMIRRFPRSSLVPDARKALNEIEKSKKDRSKCTS